MYNSAFLIDGAGHVFGRYDKHVLIPFGEYIPGRLAGAERLRPQSADRPIHPRQRARDARGPGPRANRAADLLRGRPGRHRARDDRAGAEALLTIFNDAWFGRSMAPYQHEAIALWRAIENRRYFVRVGNAGVTGVIDPFGRVLDRLGMFTDETLRADIRPLQIATLYTALRRRLRLGRRRRRGDRS